MGHSDEWIKKHYLDEGYVVCGDCKFFKPDEKKNDGSGICSKKGDIKGFNSVSICEKFRPTKGTDNMKFSKIMKEADEGYDSDTPKIYVGTYAKYNNGSIDGKWITISDYNTYEEFVDACRELHSDEKDPEFMVQDYENFPRRWYHEGGLPSEEEFDKINEYYMMDDGDKEAYEAFLDLNLWDDDSIETFQEKYEGHFNTPEDFGVHAVENFGMPENAEYYIDYEAFGRDLTMDWHRGDEDEKDAEGEPEDPDYYYDSEGYQQMVYGSDAEVGEQYIDDVGLDGLGKDAMDFYFDYDQFGRELLMTDFVEQDGFIFSNY